MMPSVTSSNEQYFGVIFVYWWCTRAPRSKQKHQKFKSIKNALFIHKNDPLGELFPMSTILVSFWCIGGALEHQKVQNHQKLKCSENAHYIHQNDALVKVFPMSTVLVSFWWIGGILEHQKVRNHQKLKCAKKLRTKARAARREPCIKARVAHRVPRITARPALR